MKTWQYTTAVAALATASLATHLAWGTTKCTDHKCNTPEACNLKNYLLEKAATAEVFADQALADAFAKALPGYSGHPPPGAGEAFAAAVQAGLDKEFPEPKCDHKDNVSQGVAMTTVDNCTTSATVGTDGSATTTSMPAAGAKPGWSPDLDKLKVCKEALAATEAHEDLHRQRCVARAGGGRNFATYMAEDAAAYQAETASVRASMDAGKYKCSPTKKDVDTATKFLKDAVAAATAANTAANEKAAAAQAAADKAAADKAAAAKAEAAKRAAAAKALWDAAPKGTP